MTSASFEFLGFSLLVVAIFNLSRSLFWRQLVLLLASAGFLIAVSPSLPALIPLVGFLAFGYAGARGMRYPQARRIFPLVVAITVSAFVWLKKYTFVPSELLLEDPYVTIGLSYIFFRVLHLIVDARNGVLPEKLSVVSYLNYTLNFTTLVSGPIQRYKDFSEMQLAPVPLPLNAIVAGNALERVISGFFKVNVLSMLLCAAQKQALGAISPTAPLAFKTLHGAIIFASYPFYLYCNFSGYIDMVVGIAIFLRLRLPENFDRPFAADNFINFWSRWHITLSEWLKTYVYNPLAVSLMRRFEGRSIEPFLGVFAFFVTFFLVGVWHGQTSEFLFFGVLQGLGVSLAKLFQILMSKRLGRKRYRALAANPTYNALARGLTFTWFTFTLLWFWSSWQQIAFISHTLGAPAVAAISAAIFFAAVPLLTLWESARDWLLSIHWNNAPVFLSRYTRTVWVTALFTTTVAVILLLHAPAPDLVYKSF